MSASVLRRIAHAITPPQIGIVFVLDFYSCRSRRALFFVNPAGIKQFKDRYEMSDRAISIVQ